MTARARGWCVRLLLTAGLVLMGAVPAHAEPPEQPETDSGKCLPPPKKSTTETPWPQEHLGQRRVWDVTRGDGVTVAVLGTGVASDTPQLAGRVLDGIDVTSDGGDADDDCYGHGTFVAGIIGAAPEKGTAFVGVAPAVTILPVRVAGSLDPQDPDSLSPESIATGIRKAVDGGAEVINVSASTTAQNESLAAAVEYAAEQDVVLVASVANVSGRNASQPYPAAYPSVIAVGATTEQGTIADFSQTGDFVDLVAPGSKVVSIGPGGPGNWQGSGTSYAAPFVSGAAALVRAYRPGLGADEVKHRLEVTATPPGPGTLPDSEFGWGVVDPVAAVTTLLAGRSASPAIPVAPPPARMPPASGDGPGPVLAVAGVAGALVVVFGFGWIARLSGSAHGRRWRRARVRRLPAASERNV